MNRVLKPGGRAVINLVYNLEFRDFERFKETVAELGFRVDDAYSGEVEAGDRYRSQLVVLEKVADVEKTTPEELSDKIGKVKRDGLKFGKTKKKLKDSRLIVTEFNIGEHQMRINFNEDDKEVYEEEQSLLVQGGVLKDRYGSIEEIPAQEIIDNNFVRIRVGQKYLLFKKLIKGSGVVIVR
jgi:hypothetical protein